MTAYLHYTARTLDGRRALQDFHRAAWLWERLRRTFPTALACVLMLDHIHLLAAANQHAALRHVLSRFAQRFGFGSLWTPVVASAVPVNKLARNLRYIHLNPSRAGLALPLEWSWSTHRDVMGAVARPWVEARQVQPFFPGPAQTFRDRFHAYVSSDPTVAVEGTPPPRPSRHGRLEAMARAACAAHRSSLASLRVRGSVRTTFCTLALRGNYRHSTVAQRCGLHPASVTRAAKRCPIGSLAAAELCLGDERLTGHLNASREEPGFQREAWRRRLSDRNSQALELPCDSSLASGT